MKATKRIVGFLIAVAVMFSAISVMPLETMTVEAGDTLKVKMCLGDCMQHTFPGYYSVKYKSSNKKVLTVDKDGTMVAVGVGKSTMTATVSGHQIKYAVTVTLTSDAKTDKKLKKLAKKFAKENKSDEKKVKAVHDYIVLKTAYDYENFIRGTIPETDDTVKGLLNTKKSVCEGYAKTFNAFMYTMGIPCKVVRGDVIGSGAHAWNVVKVKGKWYQIDVTYDDPVPDQKDRVLYSYFLITDKEMAKTHVWDRNAVPKCKTSNNQFISLIGKVCKTKGDVNKQVKKMVNNKKTSDTFILKKNSKITHEDIAGLYFANASVADNIPHSYTYSMAGYGNYIIYNLIF